MNSVKFQDTKLIYRNLLHLCSNKDSSNKELSEREPKKSIPCRIASKRVKYPGVSLSKEV